MKTDNYYAFISSFSQTQYETQKLLGQFYTDVTVADEMSLRIVETESSIWKKQNLSIVDPFCGDGRLIISLLKCISKYKPDCKFVFSIYVWDVDSVAVNIAKEKIVSFSEETSIVIETIEALSCDSFVKFKEKLGAFDICVTNPPWGILKPLKMFNKRCSENELESYKNSISEYDNYMQSEFTLSKPEKKFGKWGTNLGRCGLEVAMKLISKDGICGFVSPASLFNDQVSVNFRKWMLSDFSIYSISYYPAELKLYGSADVSSITAILSKGCTSEITVNLYKQDMSKDEQTLDSLMLERIKAFDFAIPLENGINQLSFEQKLDKLPSLSEYCKKNNLAFTRELDETGYKEKVCNCGNIVFTKGYMINHYSFLPDNLFIKEGIPLPNTYNCSKLVWRDVARSTQKRRIKATIIQPPSVTGNSLGVIYSKDSNNVELLKLLGIINSYVFEYLARKKLVSNHVPAGILKTIKVPDTIDDNFSKIVRDCLDSKSSSSVLEITVAKMYKLSLAEFNIILNAFDISEAEKSDLLLKMNDSLPQVIIPNHYAAKLSDLDMQIIKCVPPGGNWKNIPESIPSQRLVQIRESYLEGKGSRSTYYGRLLPSKPAYTINTYFNRPGNGCHIHYNQDRTISQREAARLQSFPDSFIFKGSLNAINNQIGNAVPPLLAFQIARQIPFKGQFIDLFAGAGGLALGFVWAGWKPIIANDIDKYALDTHKENINSEIIVGDINDEAITAIIEKAAFDAKSTNPDLPLFVLGGPPCQGFSTANTRRGANDMRNWLFKAYIRIVKAIKPIGFVFENVKGITNMDGGSFFEMIKKEFDECGFEAIKVNQVNSVDYAIPQRRERVILIGGKKNLVENFGIPIKTAIKNEGQISFYKEAISVHDAIDDLPEIKQAENGSSLPYRHESSTKYQQLMRGEITPEEYLSDF